MRENKPTCNRPVCLEALEGRTLLSGEPWAFFAHLIGQDAVARDYPALTGKGQAIVVIDGGVDYNHPVLGGGFGSGYKVSAGWDFASNDRNPFCDTSAHGTAVAGIIAGNHYVHNGTQNQGIVPGANIIALRVNSQAGIKAAMDWALANRAKYNIVAVDYTDFGAAPYADYNAQITKLYNAGVFVGTPAGNYGPKQYVYPNSADFTVGGIGHNDQLTSFSARGPAVNILGPADGVTVPYYDISTHTRVITDSGQGTSWAAPYVVGAAAMIKQINPKFSVPQIMSILKDSGHGVYDSTSKRTYPRLDLLAAVKLAYTRAGVVAPQAATASTQSPFSGKAIAIAAGGTVIQAENFDNGGEGVAYHDSTTANKGGQYRSTGVDIEKTADTGGGYDTGWVGLGEWLEYTVSVPTTGSYKFDFRLASAGAGGTFRVMQDGVAKTGAIQVANTGGWQKWQTGTLTGIKLTAGTHVLRLAMDSNGAAGAVANFNWFRITPSATAAAPRATARAAGRATTGWYLVGSYTGTRTGSTGDTSSFQLKIGRQRAGILSGQLEADGQTFAVSGQLKGDGTFTMQFTDRAGHRHYLSGHVGKAGTRLAGTYSTRVHGSTTGWGTLLVHKAA